MVKKLAVIGGGVMAEAVLAGILAKSLLVPASITVSDPVAERQTLLRNRFGVNTTGVNLEAVKGADALLLAIKPQVVRTVLAELAPALDPGVLVVTIIAGLATETIRRALPAHSIVRVMPNTPAQSGDGMSVWLATPEVAADQAAWARSVVAALGEEVQVNEEKYLDMATAISGSGPAYVFMFVEALADAAVQLGFSRDVALKLAWQTVRGSASFGQNSGVHPALLRNQVTSPGGTTADALEQLEQYGFRTAINQAVKACYHKSLELARGVKE